VNILKQKTGELYSHIIFYPKDFAAKVLIYKVSLGLPRIGFDNSPLWGTLLIDFFASYRNLLINFGFYSNFIFPNSQKCTD